MILTLTCSDLYTHDKATGHPTTAETVTGHPPLPGPEVQATLRRRVHDHRDRGYDPIRWYHRSGNAWAAVTDLHQAGRHDDAAELAKLLHWCDARPWDQRASMVWTLSDGPTDAHQLASSDGEALFDLGGAS